MVNSVITVNCIILYATVPYVLKVDISAEDEIKEEFIEINGENDPDDDLQLVKELQARCRNWFCIEVEGFKTSRIISFDEIQ